MGRPELKIEPAVDPLEAHVRAAQAGDDAAVGALVAATKDRLVRFLFLLGGDAALANDIAQDTYLYVLEKLKSLKEPKAFKGWLFLIAKNKFLDYKRSPRQRGHEGVEALDSRSVSDPDERELALQVRAALCRLEPEDRVLLILVDIEAHSYAEASKIIGVSESAIRSRLHRARQAFKIFYERDETKRVPGTPSK